MSSASRESAPFACPACSAPMDKAFHVLAGVPQQSNLLLATAEEAAAMPTGDLSLCFCPNCGFISNAAFSFETQELSAKYEASQGFSPTFLAFAKKLTATWTSRYQLAGKTAVEIGCGKGEFLALLCRETGCRGVGFDPTLDPNRQPDTAGLDLTLRPELFTESTAANLNAFDFVCCRHTLEHIPDVQAFIRMVRRAVGDRSHVRVAFEVPDTLRVLSEGAFWDIYYEHCSYFTPGSLASLFARCGFDVLDVRREFNDQYLILEAAPTTGVGRIQFATPIDTPADTAAAVHRFADNVAATTRHWQSIIDRAVSSGLKVVLWGASSKAVGFLSQFGYTVDTISGAVDINPHKQGTYLPTSQVPIISPQSLQMLRPDIVILMNPIYRDEINRDLQQLGVQAEVLAA